MNQIMRAVRKNIKLFSSPMPSLFDLVVCLGIIPIGHISREFKGFYLVFYTFFLIALSISTKFSRNYKNIWLALIMLWSFIGIFIHSWIVNTNSVTYKYFNFYLMSEGFIYVFAGTLYLYMIINKCKNLRLLWLTLPIALIPLINVQVHTGQMSYILALIVGLVIYSFRKSYWTLSFIMLSGLVIVAVSNISWLIMKFECRPYVWIQLIRNIVQYPLVGTGFNKLLQPDNMIWVTQIGTIEYGWLFRHNDYLSIAAFLGLPILIPIIGLTCNFYNKFKDSWKLIILSSFVIVAFFQITMFDMYKAFIILTVLGYLHVEV